MSQFPLPTLTATPTLQELSSGNVGVGEVIMLMHVSKTTRGIPRGMAWLSVYILARFPTDMLPKLMADSQ